MIATTTTVRTISPRKDAATSTPGPRSVAGPWAAVAIVVSSLGLDWWVPFDVEKFEIVKEEFEKVPKRLGDGRGAIVTS